MTWLPFTSWYRMLRVNIPETPDFSVALGSKRTSPPKFARHRDKQRRFELGYPQSWKLEVGEGVVVHSKSFGSFARVDVVPTADAAWETLQVAVVKAGGTLTILKQIAGPPGQLRAQLDMKGICFDFQAWEWPVGAETITLSTGNVVDAKRSTKVERYEDQALAAIRRHFKVPAP